jgi:hypothetical protein
LLKYVLMSIIKYQQIECSMPAQQFHDHRVPTNKRNFLWSQSPNNEEQGLKIASILPSCISVTHLSAGKLYCELTVPIVLGSSSQLLSLPW